MPELTEGEKIRIAETVTDVFSPIEATVTGFLAPHQIRHRSKVGDEPWTEWVDTVHTICVHSVLGDRFLYLSGHGALSDRLWRGCHEFCYQNQLDSRNMEVIIRKLYAPEFI